MHTEMIGNMTREELEQIIDARIQARLAAGISFEEDEDESDEFTSMTWDEIRMFVDANR